MVGVCAPPGGEGPAGREGEEAEGEMEGGQWGGPGWARAAAAVARGFRQGQGGGVRTRARACAVHRSL